MKQRKPTVDLVAVAWYKRDDFDRVRALSKGDCDLQPTFDEWLQHAEHMLTGVPEGVRVEKYTVKSDELAVWLAANNVESNSQTRAQYVHELASAKHSNKH